MPSVTEVYGAPAQGRIYAQARKDAQDLTHPFKGDVIEPPSLAYTVPDDRPIPPPEQREGPRSIAIAVILSIIVPGSGYMYLKRVTQGAAILIVIVALLFLYFFVVPLIVAVLIWLWQIRGTYLLAKEYNRIVAATGRSPW